MVFFSEGGEVTIQILCIVAEFWSSYDGISLGIFCLDALNGVDVILQVSTAQHGARTVKWNSQTRGKTRYNGLFAQIHLWRADRNELCREERATIKEIRNDICIRAGWLRLSIQLLRRATLD